MAMEALQIRVSDNNGNFLDRNYVVMYRTYSNGSWLPWVSNAEPTIMHNIQSKYNLPGRLDTASGDAGLPGSGVPVNAIEIRIFEGETAGSTGSSIGGQPVGNMKTIFIDPGHGGSDPGAVGNGLREKDITLKLSLYQAKHFKEAGYNVILSRSTDTYVSLSQRSSEANRLNADLFISNHVNAGGGKGSEVYCSRVGGTSRECANVVASALSKTFYNRGVKVKIGDDGRDYYHVIRETKMPAILIEHGFIDNSSDASILSSDANLKKLARDTVDAIKGIAPAEIISFNNNPTATSNCDRLVVSASEYNNTITQRRYKYNFIEPAIKQIKDHKKIYNKDTIRWLISSTGYSDTDIANFKDTANKLGVKITFFKNRYEFIEILNKYENTSKKIDRITVFSHGVVGSISMGYNQDNYQAGAITLNIASISNIKPKAISYNCDTRFFSCNTATLNENGTSFAKEWHKHLGGTVKAAINKTDYSCILGKSENEITEHVKEWGNKGYSDNGAIYYPQLDAETNARWVIYDNNII